MITREEAKSYGEDNGDLVAEYNDIINEIYDSFEQHIKSLEAQLANTEQLACDSCDSEYNGCCNINILPNYMHTFEFYCSKFKPKKNQHISKCDGCMYYMGDYCSKEAWNEDYAYNNSGCDYYYPKDTQ